MQLVVIAKEPRPGHVKTRLCPPCTPEQAAAIAQAALADTLDTVAALPARRHVIALDGEPGDWLPPIFHVIAQRGGALDERLQFAFADIFQMPPGEERSRDSRSLDASSGPVESRPGVHIDRGEVVVLVGMDTPQLTVAHLEEAVAALSDDHDAVLGLAPDGGYWLIGLRHLHPDAIVGVPMSEDHTGTAQLQRLIECGYRVAITGELDDVDDADDAIAIAALVPFSRFALAVSTAIGAAEPRPVN